MAFDGLVVHAISDELSSKLVGGKIDKVYQPENDEIVLHIRNNKENFKLVLSASASNPRVYLSANYKKENPINAPMFCMLLRKYIQSGNIVSVSQVGFERIIKITVESLDELKAKTTKDIIIEIMGRHSNIILTHEENKIVDSIKRIPPSVSRVRQLLPGMTYVLPPAQDKLNPLDKISKDKFKETISEFDGSISKCIYSKFLGISPIVSKEICFRSNLDISKPASSIDGIDFDNLYKEFSNVIFNIKDCNYNPCLAIDSSIDKLIDFSSIDLTLFDNLKVVHDESISSIIESFYANKDAKERINQRASDFKKSISIKLDRLYNKLKKQKIELKESDNANIYKIKGELITAYIYMIEKGMDFVEVQNFYEEDCPLIKIDLNKNLTPSENAQKYFKRYNKLKHAKKEITTQIGLSLEEINYLENIILSIDNCDNLAELDDIKEELQKLGYMRGKIKSKKDKNNLTTKPNEFLSSDGFTILVGKNNKQNDFLTLKIANNDDLWMHTKNIPGSHVIIKTEGKEIPESTIFEGAMLAAFFSKSKMSSQVPVDYTLKKNVKKPNGSKPGMVIYETNSTIYVTPSEELVVKLKKQG
ncbi:Rqc2 family fibronectin-binding protein [Paeniclostridium hominis]|uniref:Rqc2 family fibronectin-binding protein n=1 Tax=Paeniclostridium hominis TaxID=2764329 RepID=UPI0022DF685C|nr:NFACT RNA binding domain-containing protein [Paeniclostridium hominis]